MSLKTETILISKDQIEAFFQGYRGDQGPVWDQLKKYVAHCRLNETMNAWDACEKRDPSGIVTVSGLVKELGLV